MRHIRLIGGIEDPQIAYSLLRFCGAQPKGNYYARAVGEVGREAFIDMDAAALEVFTLRVTDVGPSSGLPRALVHAPPRLGGLGLRSMAAVAPLAYVAGSVAASHLLERLVPEAARASLGPDPFAQFAVPQHDSVSSAFANVLEAAQAAFDTAPRSRSLQRRLTALLDEELLKVSTPGDLDVASRARINSGSASFASAFLTPLPGTDDPKWIPSSRFVPLVRLRLGLDILDAAVDCTTCAGQDACDIRGHHAVTCVKHYDRHNLIRDQLHALFQAALLRPVSEPGGFELAPGRRADLKLQCPPALARYRGETVYVDVTCVSPFTQANVARAATEPAGAAIKACEEKLRSYAPIQGDIRVIPLAVDALGAWEPESLKFIKAAAKLWGRRFDLHPSRAVPVVLQAVSTQIVGYAGGSLARSAGAEGHPVPTPHDFGTLPLAVHNDGELMYLGLRRFLPRGEAWQEREIATSFNRRIERNGGLLAEIRSRRTLAAPRRAERVPVRPTDRVHWPLPERSNVPRWHLRVGAPPAAAATSPPSPPPRAAEAVAGSRSSTSGASVGHSVPSSSPAASAPQASVLAAADGSAAEAAPFNTIQSVSSGSPGSSVVALSRRSERASQRCPSDEDNVQVSQPRASQPAAGGTPSPARSTGSFGSALSQECVSEAPPCESSSPL